jgi:hypothetical protein
VNSRAEEEPVTAAFLIRGNGHQNANRRKALEYVVGNVEGVSAVDERTVNFPSYGRCHFAAYTDPVGAMISTPNRNDGEFGSVEWHRRDAIMMFRDFGDGRCIIYVCPIAPLFGARTIGHHGVRWEDVLRLSSFKHVFRPE